MDDLPFSDVLDQQSAVDLSTNAAKFFQPRAPINNRDFFAGRWEQMTAISDAVSQTGLHIIMFGERGVGKSSLANIINPLLRVMEESLTRKAPVPRLVVKVNINQGDLFADAWARVFGEVSWFENKPMIGLQPQTDSKRVTLKEAFHLSDEPSIDEVRRTLNSLPRSVVIFDEFDRGSDQLKANFTDLIKALSDYEVNSTIVIVGVSDTIDQLIRDHASIVRAIVQIHLPRMNERELSEILEKGSKALNTNFDNDASAMIVRMSQGLPHYTHLIGLHSTREAVKRLTRRIALSDVHKSFDKALSQAVQSLQEKYLKAIHSAHKDALYEKVILACAAASSCAKDALGYFHPSDVAPLLAKILDRPNLKIATFQKHINEFCEAARGPILERAGSPRAYKYRFHDPLLPPYIFMTSVAGGSIDLAKLNVITSES